MSAVVAALRQAIHLADNYWQWDSYYLAYIVALDGAVAADSQILGTSHFV